MNAKNRILNFCKTRNIEVISLDYYTYVDNTKRYWNLLVKIFGNIEDFNSECYNKESDIEAMFHKIDLCIHAYTSNKDGIR